MTMITNYDFEQCQTLMVEILETLRSRNVSYNTADFILEGAQKLLQQMARQELNGLPLATGLSYNIDPDMLMTASKRLVEVGA